MPKSPRKRHLKIKFDQIFIYADGPQLVLFDTATTTKFIAVAVEHEGMEDPFFGVEISSDMLADYIGQKFDLRYVFTNPTYKKWYLFDYQQVNSDFVKIISFDIIEGGMDAYLPDHGLFSRDHTEEYKLESYRALTTHQFNIDGSWDLPEFSKLYGQITDLYVMFNGVDEFLNEQASIDEKRKVQEAFIKPWQGGGSYGSFYDGLIAAQRRGDRLSVSGIQYNSPGFVNVRGREKPFVELYRLVNRISARHSDLRRGYDRLHKTLRDHKLLKLPASNFNKKLPVAFLVSDEAHKFADLLSVISYDDLYAMAGRDQLIVAKVLLSIYRRAERLYQFILEGRVQLPKVSSL